MKKLHLWFTIPFILLFLWAILSLFYPSSYSFSVIAFSYPKENFKIYKTSELFAKQKVAAEFEAKENNLGIVAVRFQNFQRISKDIVLFRIKEKDQNKWYYQGRYKVDQFQPDELFTFGFPIIKNSEGKQYYFEIESTIGEHFDAIALSSMEPAFVTQYQFSKSELLANKRMLPLFIFKKIFYSFSDTNFTISSIDYLLPFLFYMFWIHYFKKYLSPVQIKYLLIKYKKYVAPSNYTLFYLYIGALLITILLDNKILLYEKIILLILWLGLIRVYKFHSSITFFFSLIWLLIAIISLIFNQGIIAENAAIWIYIYIIIGTLQTMYELRKRPEDLLTIDLLLHKLFRIK